MLPYWFLFTLCAAGAVQYRPDTRSTTHGGPLLTAVAVLILLMIGFRWEVGGDWINYMLIFQFIRYESLGDVIGMSDPGYAVLNWVAQQFGVDIWFVNLVCGAVFVYGLYKFARQQLNPWLVVLAAVPYLIIVVAMGYTRQAVAIGLMLAGMARLRDRQSMVEFGFFIIAAAAFHKSAVIILPIVAMAATKNRAVMLFIGALLVGLLYYLFLNEEFDRLMRNYVESNYDSQGAMVRVAMNVPPAIIYLLFQKRFGLTDFERKLWRNFAIAALVAMVMVLSMESTTVVDRLALYLIPIQLVVFSRLPTAFPIKGRPNTQLIAATIAYCAAVQFVWLTYAANAHYWVPYSFWPITSEACTRGIGGCA